MARRINDAQTERLLDAMRRDPKYRTTVAKHIVEQEGLQPGTEDYRRRYRSTMRRLQRYVAEGKEKRSFARAPKEIQREIRHASRSLPPSEREQRLAPWRDIGERDIGEYDLSTLGQAVRAYYDGDIEEAARELGLSRRASDLLDLATTGEGADVEKMRGAGEIQDRLADWLEGLPEADIEDVRAFHDLFMNLPDWEIGMILQDLADGYTTFADWIDAYAADGYEIYDIEDSQFWVIFRAAYARAKG